jgi:hypothetical protein
MEGIMNPAEIIYNWFVKLPVEHRHAVAFHTLAMLPGFPIEKAMDTENQVEYFTEWLLAENDLKHHAVGRAIFIKAAINFSLANRAHDSSWDKTFAFFEHVKNTITEDAPPGIAKTSEHEQEMIALRKRQWKKSLAEWDELCDGPLSHDSLSATLVPDF